MATLLRAQLEAWHAVLPELVLLFPANWRETDYHHDRIPLAPAWDTYAAQERAGNLVLVTLREGRDLVGYCVTFVVPEIHHDTSQGAHTDMFYVARAYRGRLGSVRLLRATEAELRRRGVVRWLVGTSHRGDGGRLMAALGFTPIETTYARVLGDGVR